MKRGYRQYLQDGGKIPRSTICRRRRRVNDQALLRYQLLLDSSNANSAETSMTDHSLPPTSTRILQEEQTIPLSLRSEEVQDKPGENIEAGVHDLLMEVDSSDDILGVISQDVNDSQASCSPSRENSGEIFGATSTNSDLIFQVSDRFNNLKTAIGSANATLCPCTTVTKSDVYVQCLALALRHSLSWEVQLDILRLIDSIYGSKKVQISKQKYVKLLSEDESEIQFHLFCPDCQVYIGKRAGKKGCMLCPKCKTDINVASVDNLFMSASVEEQLRKMLLLPGLADLILTYRFNRVKDDPKLLEDIFDGAEYQRHFKGGGLLSHPSNFSYSFFTDGVSTGKSSHKTMWPIYLTINELPPKERRKHVILAGLYVGPRDPDHRVFLKPFVEMANKLSTEGFAWDLKGVRMHSKVIPLIAVVDSVARFQVMNFQSFHARRGCTFCYIKQHHTRKGLKYTINPSKDVKQRNDASHMDDLREVYNRRNELKEEDRVFNGVKGFSSLLDLKYFNFFPGIVVDYMHTVLLGAIRTHINLLLHTKYKDFWLIVVDDDRMGMDHIVTAIDERLKSIKPPTCITRTPRPMSRRKVWKANEWRSWLLFYCIPCLDGLLKEKYILHLCLLSKAVYILLQKRILPEDVTRAHTLLKSYMFMFQQYFGEEEMVYNIHLLSHLSRCVLSWGPLWTHNSFLYESQNRFLLGLCKSGFQVVLQVVRKYLLFFSFPLLCEKLLTSEMAVEFCENVLDRRLKIFLRCGKTVLLGRGRAWESTLEESQCLQRFCNISKDSCVAYQKLIHKSTRLSTLQYHENTKNGNGFVFLVDGRIAAIRHILLVPTFRVLLLVQIVVLQSHALWKDATVSYDHVRMFERYGEIVCLEPDSVNGCAIQISPSNGVFFSRIPFGCYED